MIFQYQEVILRVPQGYASRTAVVATAPHWCTGFCQELLSHLRSPFKLQLKPVLLTTSVFPPFSWPWESSALAQFGYDKIQVLSSPFAVPLQQQAYSPKSCSKEWLELKFRVKKIPSKDPTVKYLPMWQRIISEYKEHPALTNILALLNIVLVILVQTATLECGFSLIKWTKSDSHNRISQKTLT